MATVPAVDIDRVVSALRSSNLLANVPDDELRAAPSANGILFERPHVLEEARPAFADAGMADRCAFASGDFNAGVPAGGDVYILSRVLHDWDDDTCATILALIAGAMREDGSLLIVERLLPEDRSPSLAFAWDIHMLCNVGGRERTSTHFGEMLAGAGFEVTARHALPLDVFLLTAERTGNGDRPRG